MGWESQKFTVAAFFDGGSRGNPGPSAGGTVIYWPDGTKTVAGVAIGNATCNEAEYRGALLALSLIAEWRRGGKRGDGGRRVDRVELHGDSKLILAQLGFEMVVMSPHLQGLAKKCWDMAIEVGAPITYVKVPRKANAEADRVVNTVLDMGAPPEQVVRLDEEVRE